MFAPLLPIACGSFGSSPEPVNEDAGSAADDARAESSPSPLDDGEAPVFDGGGPVPPLCPLIECPSGHPGADCKDDSCAPEDTDFTMSGGATRTDGGTCDLPAGTTGFFERGRPRYDTPAQFVELAFDLLDVDTSASAKIADLSVGGSATPRVSLALAGGRLSLCTTLKNGTSCPSSIDIPKGKRVHFYGVFDRTAGMPQTFGVSVDCSESLRIVVPEKVGDGSSLVGRLGCLDAPCGLVADNPIILTRPPPAP